MVSGDAYAQNESIMSLSLSTDQININPPAGQFVTSKETVSVSSTSESGYSVSLSTAGHSSSLIDNTLQEEIPTFSVPAGSKTVPRDSTGFGYGFSIDGGNNFYPIPDPLDSGTLIYSSNYVGDSVFDVDFGFKVDPMSPTGTYRNRLVITATANNNPVCPSGYICYHGNNDDGTGSMRNQLVVNGTPTKLTPSNFSRPGYGFAGWNTEADGSGTTYGPEETVNLEYPSFSGIILYAMWIEPSGLMQNWNGCSSMATGDIVALTDFRDNEVYTIAKLADGKCWTVENSRLNPSTTTISKSNTNNPTDSFVDDVRNSNPAGNQFCATNDANCINQILYNVGNMNRSYTASSNDNGSFLSWYSYGTFFNWYTATAGNGTYQTTSTSVSGDICPAGWRLPTGGSRSSDWDVFNQAVNNGSTRSDTLLRTYPVNMIYAGDFNTNSTSGRGTQSRYWSSTASNDASKTVRFGYSATEVSPAKTYNKWVAFPIRCILKDNNPVVHGNIHYDANGGSGTMTNTDNVNLYTASAKENTFTPPSGQTFQFWNTQADGSGTTVFDKDMVAEAVRNEGITEGGTLTLYAFWGRVATLSFNANGGYDAPAPLKEYENGSGTWVFQIPNLTPRYVDRTFRGWSTDPAATVGTYWPGDSITLEDTSLELYAVWALAECDPNRICYRGNMATSGTEFSDTVSSNTTVNLTSPNYARDGYGFAGWNTKPDGTGENYGPNEAISIGDVSVNGLNLYSIWVQSSGNLQGWQGCSALSVNQVIALRDIRDNNVYSITKHNDGHCWFMENLRLDPSTASINASNTNLPTLDFISGLGGSSSSNTICNTNNSSCINSVAYNTNNINRNLIADPRNNSERSWYSYGVDYNWYTATAGNGDFSITSGSVTGDICPAGWRLPTGSSSGEYMQLNNVVNGGSTTSAAGLLKYPVNIVFSGDYNNNKPGGRGSYFRLWSSTANSATNAFRFGGQTNNVTPMNNWNKWVTFPVRCIAT